MLLAVALFAFQGAPTDTLQFTAPHRDDAESSATSMVIPDVDARDSNNIRFELPQGGAKAAASTTQNKVSDKATFLFSKERLGDDSDADIGVEGFLNGLRGFEHFYNPVGQPIYFETPFNETGLRPLFLHHKFPGRSQIDGGNANIFAVQARLAITERLGFIATKDGRTWLRAGLLPDDNGWNDIAIGLKYVAIADRENDFVLTPGFRWQWENGSHGVLQGFHQEYSPFVSVAKGFDRFHIIGNVTYRIPDTNHGNEVLHWDAHFDYEIAPKSLPGVAPLIEIHSVHYLTDGKELPVSIGGLDYTNLGSMHVAGENVIWLDAGARAKFSPNFSMGIVYGWSITHAETDIFDQRLTLDFELKW